MTFPWTRRRTRPAIAPWVLAFGLSGSVVSAQVVTELKDLSGEVVYGSAQDDAGSVVYAVSSSNQFGTNPGYRAQIFRFDPVSGAGSQITNFAAGVQIGYTFSVSDDGQWLAFTSNGDLTGANHDESVELFVMHPDGTGLSQVTNDASYTGDGIMNARLAGSGNRIVFVADTDPLGTNPGRTPHAFAVDRDGTGMIQLAPLVGYRFMAAISDDGERVVMSAEDSSAPQPILAGPSDGSSPPVPIVADQWVSELTMSGNGEIVVFGDFFTISKVNYDGTGLIAPLASGAFASITDDGSTVYYDLGDPAPTRLWRIGSDGTGATLVLAGTPPLGYFSPQVSGDGSRLAVYSGGGEIVGGHNPDGGTELLAMDAAGGNAKQLTDMSVASASVGSPVILPNGTRVYFRSADDILGENPDHNGELFTMLPDGTALAQLTHLSSNATNRGAGDYSVSDAGVIVFESSGDHTGQNSCGRVQLFRINGDGTGLTQLTTNCDGPGSVSLMPALRYDGQWIVYLGDQRVGTNTEGRAELMKISVNGGTVTPLTDENEDTWKYYALSATTSPTWIAYASYGNADGMNANHLSQICRISINGTSFYRITKDPTWESTDPDISGDGTKVVWISGADFVGQNPDHSPEVFVRDFSGLTVRQVTNTTGGIEGPLEITRDAAWVTFMLDGDIVRAPLATGVIQRVTGFRHATSRTYGFDMVSSGSKMVFGGRDIIGRGPSAASLSLFLTDFSKKPAFTVGKATPTLLSWDPDPQSVRYDVVRGDVASLAMVGSTVDLGPVTCVEDDSPDNATVGYEDALQPNPGQCFFYLYRGTTGVPPVTASWGQGTGARERVAGAGGCGP